MSSLKDASHHRQDIIIPKWCNERCRLEIGAKRFIKCLDFDAFEFRFTPFENISNTYRTFLSQDTCKILRNCIIAIIRQFILFHWALGLQTYNDLYLLKSEESWCWVKCETLLNIFENIENSKEHKDLPQTAMAIMSMIVDKPVKLQTEKRIYWTAKWIHESYKIIQRQLLK